MTTVSSASFNPLTRDWSFIKRLSDRQNYKLRENRCLSDLFIARAAWEPVERRVCVYTHAYVPNEQ